MSERPAKDRPWVMRTSSSQEEGGEREFAILTKRFLGDAAGRVRAIECIRVEHSEDRRAMREVEGSTFELKADLVFLAMGFVGPTKAGVVEQSGVELDPRGNVKADTRAYRTSVDKVFSAGDMRRGQSLIVWAIREGRQAARAIDEHLRGASVLPA